MIWLFCEQHTAAGSGSVFVLKIFWNVFVMESYPSYDSVTLPWEKLHGKMANAHTWTHNQIGTAGGRG